MIITIILPKTLKEPSRPLIRGGHLPQICRFSQSATSSRETLGWHRSSHKTGVAAPKQFLPTDPTFTAAAHAILVDAAAAAAAAAVIAAVTLLLALLQCCCCCFWCSCCSASGNFNSFRPFPDGNLATESGGKLVFGTISDPANGAGTRPLRKLRNTLLVLFVLREAERLGRQVSKVIPIATRCLKHKTPKWWVFFPR